MIESECRKALEYDSKLNQASFLLAQVLFGQCSNDTEAGDHAYWTGLVSSLISVVDADKLRILIHEIARLWEAVILSGYTFVCKSDPSLNCIFSSSDIPWVKECGRGDIKWNPYFRTPLAWMSFLLLILPSRSIHYLDSLGNPTT